MTIFIIFISITSFMMIMLIMVILLLIVKHNLSYNGLVKITINNKKIIEVNSGNSLLYTLANNNFFLPSACGGGATCLQCKCQVISGGGIILPIEEQHFTRKQKEENWRLACQVKIKEDNLKIIIPETVFGIKKWECYIKSNYNVSSFIKEIIIQLPDNEKIHFSPGGYIQIHVPKTFVEYQNIDITSHPKYHSDPNIFIIEWDKYNLWNLKMINKKNVVRAYSMANHPNEGENIIMLNVRIAIPPLNKKLSYKLNPGICSSYLFSRKISDKIIISGPYGDFFINEKSHSEMIYIGGGAGMAPMRSHIFHLFYNQQTTRKVSFWYGGRSRKELFYLEDFYKIQKKFSNFKFYVVLSEPSLDDNWIIKKNIDDKFGDGFVGFVHQLLLDKYLINHKSPENIEFYFCGPPIMNKAVLKMCDELGVPKNNLRFDDFG